MQPARMSPEAILAASREQPASSSAARPIGPSASRCANCGQPIGGRYCAECGQRTEHAVHSLGHFLREAAEDLTHADSRLWRTLIALALRPGFMLALMTLYNIAMLPATAG